MPGPHFICLGTQKAGTGWVYDQFEAHRDFWMPPMKEIGFFCGSYGEDRRPMAARKLGWMSEHHGRGKADYLPEIDFLLNYLHRRWRAGSLDFSAYFRLFDGRDGLSGDCTPEYALLKGRMVRAMYTQMPQTRFVLLLRDPIDRIWSQVQMNARLGRLSHLRATRDFADFQTMALHDLVAPYSRMSLTIRRWQEVDTEGRFKVFFFDDLRDDPEGFRASLAAHLQVDPEGFGLPAHLNRKAGQPGKRALPEEWRAWLAPHFAREYRQLAALVGGAAEGWAATAE